MLFEPTWCKCGAREKKTLSELLPRGLFVPGAGVEPAHPFGHWCLRPTRLPIPPSGPVEPC